MKLKYIKPVSERVYVRLYAGILQEPIDVGGQSQRTKPSDSLGNDNSMFDTDEGTEGQRQHSHLWEWEF